MKRQIVCNKCFHIIPTYPGEWYKVVHGHARKDMFCDLCAADIWKDDYCHAESFGLDGQPYYPWEHKYLKKEA